MINKIFSSYRTMYILLFILAAAAAIGTFLENDYGNNFAREYVYTSLWYQIIFLLSAINMVIILVKAKVKLLRPGPIFHFAIIIILIGAFVTHNFGIDGLMHIRQGEQSNSVIVGNQHIETPFSIKLNKFELKRYPGSEAPSEFSSDVIVFEKNGDSFRTNIYMNNTLTYKGYKFFQSSYDTDEKGTILSVNKDPGVELTYIGYALLFLGLLLTVFDRKSRLRFLIRKIKKMPIATVLLPLMIMGAAQENYAQKAEYSEYIEAYIIDHRDNSKELAADFGRLIVQGPTGRMKPLDTQNKEVLNKLTGKSTWNGMNANQVILGMFSRPNIWKNVNIIKVKTPRLRKLLGVPSTQKYLSFADFFEDGKYRLTKETNAANQLNPSRRGTYERDLLQVDELLNVAFMSYRGMLLKIFPKPNDAKETWVDMPTMFMKLDNESLTRNTETLLDLIYNRKYTEAIPFIKIIQDYQNKEGKNVIPTQKKVEVELWYNGSALFVKLFIAYLLLGFFLLIYSLISMFYNRLVNTKVTFGINLIVLILFLVHAFGIGIRWYIGGYAPISNTYETMVYIAFSSVLAGVVFFRRSAIALGASLIMAGTFIFAAWLGEINPQITSLVPVLKSYWLSIHVSVITASYGFFGVSAILGFITLIIFILRSKKRTHLDSHIKNITYINEITLIIGIILLTIGNFLGAIWANESWGRYWGWDPKETWTYIAIIVYTLVIHLRLFKGIFSYYLFALFSLISYYTILMTYFGVNFYLSGMHSYATGDPVPIPNWVYHSIAIITTISILAYQNRKLKIED